MRKLALLLLIHALFFSLYSQVATENLVAYWSFDHDTGSVVIDGSSNRLDGTPYYIEYANSFSGNYIELKSFENGSYCFPLLYICCNYSVGIHFI